MMKRFLKRLTGCHWIALIFVVLFVGTFINEDGAYSASNKPYTRAHSLYHQVDDALNDQPLVKDSYSYFRVVYYYDDLPWLDRIDRWGVFQGWHRWKVLVEIGVTDEAVIDALFASWTGEKWDKLVKVPTDCSMAKQEEFIERAHDLDWGPGVDLYCYADDRDNFLSSRWDLPWPRIIAWAELIQGTPAEGTEADWLEMPQQLKDLAKEMGVPEEIIFWSEPTRRAEPSEDLLPAEGD